MRANTRAADATTALKERKQKAGFVIFFHSCTSLFLNRKGPTAIGRLRRQSPHYHQGLMKQIALGALAASQCAVERGDMGGVEGAGGGIQGWLDSLQSAVRNRQETLNQLVCAEDRMAPAERQPGTKLAGGIGHKCYHQASSEMLTLSPSSRSGHCLLCLGLFMASAPTCWWWTSRFGWMMKPHNPHKL